MVTVTGFEPVNTGLKTQRLKPLDYTAMFGAPKGNRTPTLSQTTMHTNRYTMSANLAGTVGFEPTTYALTVHCSTN